MAATGNEFVKLSQYKSGIEDYIASDAALATSTKNGTVRFVSDDNFCKYMGIPYTPTLLAQDGVSITDNRSTKNGDSVHIEATVHVSAGVSGTLFTIPSSIAPSSQLTDDVGWTLESGTGRYSGTLYLNTDGSAHINGAISSYDNVKGTVTFDYSLQ